MPANHDTETDDLVHRAGLGDESAIHILLDRHRARLTQMVAVRMDDRLQGRIDPSDVVQETLIDAFRKLPDYLQERPLPFYPWLRQIAWNRLVDLHREHISAGRRTVNRETSYPTSLSSQSHQQFADQWMARDGSPSAGILREELVHRMQQSIAKLTPSHREVLILRHIEGLSVIEVAAILRTSESAITSRHFRALARLRELLSNDS